MSFFLKKTNKKKGQYLQIYKGTYDPETKNTKQKSYRSLGYVHELKQQGIKDPLTYYDDEIAKLNLSAKAEREKDNVKLITEETPEKYLGHFLLKSINDALGVKNHLNFFHHVYDFNFNIYELLSSLIYARVIFPTSKIQSYNNVVPRLFETYDFSKDQMYRAVEFFGLEYKKIIEIYNNFIKEKYGFDTSSTYFDCTNFYFEIDREDELRRKGPSKENRREPIVGMGLLLDHNQIPLNMKIFPGNQSEVDKLPEIIRELKTSQNIKSKTIRVADKGLNTTKNIVDALASGDGYIFTKSVKKLPEIEKTWIRLDNDYQEIRDVSGKLIYKYKQCIDEFPYTLTDENNKRRTFKLKEKRVVTYTPSLAVKQKREINKLVEKAKTHREFQAKRSEYGDSAKFVTFESTDKDGIETEGKVKVKINQDAINEALSLAGYNLIVTSEINFTTDYIISTYRNLWRIEESFRVMKSFLDARPVYMQKEASIIGHFLICYLSVLLLRLLQFKELDNKCSSEEIINFIRNFKVAKLSSQKYLNLTKASPFINTLNQQTNLPINSYYLSKGQLNNIINYKF